MGAFVDSDEIAYGAGYDAGYADGKAQYEGFKDAYEETLQKLGFIQRWMQEGKLPVGYLGRHYADICYDLLKEKFECGQK